MLIGAKDEEMERNEEEEEEEGVARVREGGEEIKLNTYRSK